MSNRMQFKNKLKVSVKHTITLRQTIKMASLGSSAAGLICLIMFIAFNSNTSEVKAGNQSSAGKNSKSFVEQLNNLSESFATEFQNKLNENQSQLNALNQQSKQTTQPTINTTPTNTTEDFIHIYPKNTTGVFNIEFDSPGANAPKIELLDHKGNIVETKISQPENGKVLESFIMDNNLPNGPYLIRVSMNRQLFIRQVIFRKTTL